MSQGIAKQLRASLGFRNQFVAWTGALFDLEACCIVARDKAGPHVADGCVVCSESRLRSVCRFNKHATHKDIERNFDGSVKLAQGWMVLGAAEITCRVRCERCFV